MKLYNTLTKSKEEVTGGRMYTCGPTVYSSPHVGNFRAFFFAGLLRKTLNLSGIETTHVCNITDVGHLTDDGDQGEDKMEKTAKSQGLDCYALAEKYTKEFMDGLDVLGIEFDHLPRATDFIQEQIDYIDEIDTKYKTEDGIYFDTSLIDYGHLRKPEGIQEGLRVEMGGKKNPTDFALWKFGGEERQMIRDSPRGRGFPGWHIECSAMSRALLGQTFDIHTGGVDHIQIHHNNEIAQSVGCCGKVPAKHWMHVQFLQIDGSKISKSKGGCPLLSDLEDPSALQYFYMTSKYSSFQDFNEGTYKSAIKTFNKLNKLFKDIPEEEGEIYNELLGILKDDLDTPKFLSKLHSYKKDYPGQCKKIFYQLIKTGQNEN